MQQDKLVSQDLFLHLSEQLVFASSSPTSASTASEDRWEEIILNCLNRKGNGGEYYIVCMGGDFKGRKEEDGYTKKGLRASLEPGKGSETF